VSAKEDSVQTTYAAPASVAAKSTSATVQAVLAMTLGLFVVFMVGFSHIGVVHNAAHDVRHSSAFPCH
jgi:cobalt transporter subunit CbtB